MINKTKLIVIYDSEKVFKITNDLNQEGEINFFEFDSLRSRSIDDTAKMDSKSGQRYAEIFNYLRVVEIDELAIILDLDLAIGSASMLLGVEYDIFKDNIRKGKDGAILAVTAIRNLGIKKLLVYISSASLTTAYKRLSPKLVEETKATRNNNSVKISHAKDAKEFFDHEYSINEEEQKNDMALYIAEMERDWQNTFPVSSDRLKDELLRAITRHDGHPETEDDFMSYKQIHQISCSQKLVNCSTSFKALYSFQESEYTHFTNRYAHQYEESIKRSLIFLDIIIFKEILDFVGITVDIEDFTGNFNMPIPRGMIFIICLVDFLNSVNINSITLSKKQKKIADFEEVLADTKKESSQNKYNSAEAIAFLENKLYDPKEVVASIKIEMPEYQGKNVRTFMAGFNTGTGGTSTESFRRLLACDKYTISEYLNRLVNSNVKIITSDKSSKKFLQGKVEKCIPYALKKAPGHTKQTFLDVIRYKLEDEAIILEWDLTFVEI